MARKTYEEYRAEFSTDLEEFFVAMTRFWFESGMRINNSTHSMWRRLYSAVKGDTEEAKRHVRDAAVRKQAWLPSPPMSRNSYHSPRRRSARARAARYNERRNTIVIRERR